MGLNLLVFPFRLAINDLPFAKIENRGGKTPKLLGPYNDFARMARVPVRDNGRTRRSNQDARKSVGL